MPVLLISIMLTRITHGQERRNEIMEKIHLNLSAMFGDRYVTNNDRVNTLTMVTKITLGQEGTNEIMGCSDRRQTCDK